LLELLEGDPGLEGVLERALEWEEESDRRRELGWTYSDVGAAPSTIVKLLNSGVIFKTEWSTRSHRRYRLSDPGSVREAIALWRAPLEAEEEEEVPGDLFAPIVGYEEAKELMLRVVESRVRVHFLLVGPPSSGKSLFLLCLERLPRSRYILGSRLSRAGLADYLITHKPSFILLDEIDKLRAHDYAVLLSLCETGRVVETLYGKTREESLDTIVFASANDLASIPPEVVSRFLILRFREYSRDEFVDVAINVLGRREGVDRDLAAYIAEKVWDELESRDIRDCVRIARIVRDRQSREEVDRVIGAIRKYR